MSQQNHSPTGRRSFFNFGLMSLALNTFDHLELLKRLHTVTTPEAQQRRRKTDAEIRCTESASTPID